jgi:protein-disulfide reductase (glutathione)
MGRCAGFGDEVEWMKLDEGLAAAKENNKLAMVVVHKSWCGACKRLGPSFAEEQRVKDLADNFVMINVHDDGASSISQPHCVIGHR